MGRSGRHVREVLDYEARHRLGEKYFARPAHSAKLTLVLYIVSSHYSCHLPTIVQKLEV